MDLQEAVRHVLLFALGIFFLYRVFRSQFLTSERNPTIVPIHFFSASAKVRLGNTSFDLRKVKARHLLFPSVTICPWVTSFGQPEARIAK